MAYCTRSDLSARIPARGSQTGYEPLTDAMVQDIIDGIGADIDAKLAGLSFTVPVSDPASAVAYLRTLNTWGAVAEVLKAMFRSASGPNTEASWSFYETRYKAGMTGLGAWAEGVLGVGAAMMPSSYTTLRADADVNLGANAEPLLGVRMEW